MDLIYLTTVLASAVIVIFFLTRIFLFIISWYLSRKFSIKLTINRIGLLPFSLKGISVSLPQTLMNIEVESLGLRVLNYQERSFEAVLENLWCWRGERHLRPANPNSMKKYHQQLPLFLTMLVIKGRFKNPDDTKIDCTIDGLQANLVYFIKLINQLDISSLKNSESSFKTSISSKLNNYLSAATVQMNLSSINIFTSDLMLRVDSAALDSNRAKLIMSVNGFAVTTICGSSSTITSLLAAELIHHRIVYFSFLRLNCNHESNEMSISITEEFFLMWNASFHLTMLDLYEQLYLKISNYQSSIPSIRSFSLNLKFDGKITFGALLSNAGNRMNFATEYLSLTVADKVTLKSEFVSLNFDEHNIMNVENLFLVYIPESVSQTFIKRKTFQNPSLKKKKNRVLAIIIDTVIITFPYNYNFADVFNERFITIIKWLKLIHKNPNGQTKESSKIPFDMLIKIHSGRMEIGDDPFEIKLRDNFELLEDEHHESIKRGQMLADKIEEIKRRNILLPSSKLEELHSAFAKQNAKTYIERSKKLYATSQMRTQLFTVTVEGLNFEIVADSSYSSYDQMVSILRRIDKESPFPEDLKFSTLWCRRINGAADTAKVTLRDFSQPMMYIKDLILYGTVIGAEQEASQRATRTCYIDVGPNFESISIQRSMTTLKFYHDLIAEATTLTYTHGVCWEPILQQLNLSFEYITKPSLDPSPSLSWWDKMRFLFHGSIVIVTDNLSLIFHASLNPYNTKELIEIAAFNSIIDWLNGKILMKGTLDLLVHTESKYDECRIAHLPAVNICINLNWVCSGHENDHHSVMPCAPDKIPQYSINQTHDSYRNFRSHNLNVSASLETRPSNKPDEIPSIVFYSSTIRWLENKQFMVTGLVRLTRRGKLFGNTKPRKPAFGRIFKSIRVAICLHKFKISYWTSFEMQRGFEIISANLSHSAEHVLSLVTPNDGLIHRPKPVWDMSYMNTELNDVEVCLLKGMTEMSVLSDTNLHERLFLLNLRRVSYNRETKSNINLSDNDSPIHRLVVDDLRGAWTKDNRDVAFGLFDNYVKAQLLKRNLSTDALKGFKVDSQSSSSPTKSRSLQSTTTSPASTISKCHAASMLQKLIAEAENLSVVYTEDIENAVTTETPQLHGVAACQTNDVIHKNWLIELVNSQVMLRGCETDGYVIVSAAKAEILQSIHRPVWKNRTLYSKTTWQGSLDCMQYYATVDAGGIQNGDVTWLTVDNIEERDNSIISEISDLVGSGQSVGGVVSSEVGLTDSDDMTDDAISQIQLQRIVSRCGCQFFYASYGENVDFNELQEVPPLPENDDLLLLEPWDTEVAVDSFTLTHHELEISTNSQQFSMIVDLVNNLLLYVETHKKEAFEQQQRILFAMQLSSIDDQKEPISQLQDKLRALVAKLVRLEKEGYAFQRALAEENGFNSEEEEKLIEDVKKIELEIEICKQEIDAASQELTLMINCFKEAQLTAHKNKERQAAEQEGREMFLASVIRRSEVCFKHASWRLTDADGQLGLADLVLSNFLYSKVTKNDDSVEHTFELGYIHASNLLPNQVYKDVLQPTELQPNIPLDRHRALRIFCRERAPVGGISVKEHLELNVIPFTIGLTYAFFKKMLKFFFSDRETPTSGVSESDEITKNKKKSNLKKQQEEALAASNLTLASTNSKNLSTNQDNIEKMRKRAQKNHSFVYIKIPEVPITISYKGTKGIDDLQNVSLIIPTIEYHNRTWTWLDLLMALKSDSRRVLLSQALKQKFHISIKNKSASIDSDSLKQLNQEEDEQDKDKEKARLLLGDLAVPSTPKTSKSSRGLSLFSHKK